MSTRGTGGPARRQGNPKGASGGCLFLVVVFVVLVTIAIVRNHGSDAGSSDSGSAPPVVGVVPLSTDMNACVADCPSSTVSLLDQGAYLPSVYCAVDGSAGRHAVSRGLRR